MEALTVLKKIGLLFSGGWILSRTIRKTPVPPTCCKFVCAVTALRPSPASEDSVEAPALSHKEKWWREGWVDPEGDGASAIKQVGCGVSVTAALSRLRQSCREL